MFNITFPEFMIHSLSTVDVVVLLLFIVLMSVGRVAGIHLVSVWMDGQ